MTWLGTGVGAAAELRRREAVRARPLLEPLLGERGSVPGLVLLWGRQVVKHIKQKKLIFGSKSSWPWRSTPLATIASDALPAVRSAAVFAAL